MPYFKITISFVKLINRKITCTKLGVSTDKNHISLQNLLAKIWFFAPFSDVNTKSNHFYQEKNITTIVGKIYQVQYTPTTWLTQHFVLGKGRVNQKWC